MDPIIARSAWDARYGRGSLDPGPEPRVVIHHSFRPALGPDAGPEEERAAVRSIEGYHVQNNGWAGIGYNFLVAPSGRVYEGRGWKYRGSHAGPVNGESIGICLLIDGSVTVPGDAMVRAVRELIRLGVELGEISPAYAVSGHRDHMPRTCPGDRVYAMLADLRHDAAPPDLRLEGVRWPRPEIAAPATPHPASDDHPALEPREPPLPRPPGG